MEHLLNKLNDSVERAITKIDDQGQRLTGIEVKVDLYRESQNDLVRKTDVIDKLASDASSSAKSAHKRLDGIQEERKAERDDLKWWKRSIIMLALGWLFNLFLKFS